MHSETEKKPVLPSAAPKPDAETHERNLTMMLNNSSVLANKNHQLRPARLADGLDKAVGWDADVVLGTELGTTAKTLHLQDCHYESDWSTHSRPIPGKGVGIFFHARWQERWIHIPVQEAPEQ